MAGALPRTPCCLSTRFALAVVIVSASKFPGFHTHFGKVHGYIPLIPLFNSSSPKIQPYPACASQQAHPSCSLLCILSVLCCFKTPLSVVFWNLRCRECSIRPAKRMASADEHHQPPSDQRTT